MISAWNHETHSDPRYAQSVDNILDAGGIVLAAHETEDGPALGIGYAQYFDADKSTHPGWYISISVMDGKRGQGHGYQLVAELLRRIPETPVYLLRPNTSDRAFKGGFGFVPVEGEYYVKGVNSALALFVAENPDPDWKR